MSAKYQELHITTGSLIVNSKSHGIAKRVVLVNHMKWLSNGIDLRQLFLMDHFRSLREKGLLVIQFMFSVGRCFPITVLSGMSRKVT